MVMGRQWRKVYVDIAMDVGLDAAYILDALINARNFQNTDEVVFTKSDAEKIGIARYPFEKAISALEKAGYVARIPASKPMRFVIYDKSYKPISTDSDPSYKSISTDRKVDINLSKSRNDPSYESISTDTTIKREENNRELVESKNINNNQPELDSLIFDFFINRGYSKAEAQKFIQYNKETKGKDHLNHDNYQTLGKMWIDNIRRKPKRAEVSSMRDPGRSDYKTAGEIARERGITVDEVLDELFPDIEKTKWDPEHQYDNDEDLIEVVFWEGFGEG